MRSILPLVMAVVVCLNAAVSAQAPATQPATQPAQATTWRVKKNAPKLISDYWRASRAEREHAIRRVRKDIELWTTKARIFEKTNDRRLPEALETLQQLDQAFTQVCDPNFQPPGVPFPADLEPDVGAMGKITFAAEVFQVVDSRNMLIKGIGINPSAGEADRLRDLVRADSDNRAVQHSVQASEFGLIWLSNFSTAGVVDGSLVSATRFPILKVVGTKQYKTVAGSSLTVWQVAPIDVRDYLEESTQGDAPLPQQGTKIHAAGPTSQAAAPTLESLRSRAIEARMAAATQPTVTDSHSAPVGAYLAEQSLEDHLRTSDSPMKIKGTSAGEVRDGSIDNVKVVHPSRVYFSKKNNYEPAIGSLGYARSARIVLVLSEDVCVIDIAEDGGGDIRLVLNGFSTSNHSEDDLLHLDKPLLIGRTASYVAIGGARATAPSASLVDLEALIGKQSDVTTKP